MVDFERLVDRIYEAATVPDLWPSLLTDIAGTVDTEGGSMTTLRSDGASGWDRVSPGLAKRAEERARSDFVKRSIALPRLIAANLARFVADFELFTPEEYAADPLIAKWAIPNNVYHGAATAIHSPTGDLAIVQVFRRLGEPPLHSQTQGRPRSCGGRFGKCAGRPRLASPHSRRAARAASGWSSI